MLYKKEEMMRKHPKIINNTSFFNRIRLHGVKLTCEKLLIFTKIASDGRADVLIFRGGFEKKHYYRSTKVSFQIVPATIIKKIHIPNGK